MATSTQLASMRERTETSPPADTRPPTSASLPILSPAHQPTAPVFAIVPPGLTPAQRAAHTRAGRAAGIIPAKGEAQAKATRPALWVRPEGLSLVLSLTPTPDGKGLAVSFGHGQADPATIPEGERGLRFLSAIATRGEGGELEPATGMSFTGTASADELAAILPLMRQATASLCQAYTDSEDPSFPQMVLTLAGIYRVDRVEFTPPGGELVSAKRGAAYITAFKAGEAFKPAPAV